MPGLVFDIYDPVTHQKVFSKEDFTYLMLADFSTGTAAGSLPVSIPAGAEVRIQQSTPEVKAEPSLVSIGGGAVNWTAGANSRVRVMIR